MVIRGQMMILMMPFQREKLLGMAELLFPTPGEEKEEKEEEEEEGGRRWSSRRGGSKESESEECESEESGIGETGSDGSSLGREEEGRGRSRRVCR